MKFFQRRFDELFEFARLNVQVSVPIRWVQPLSGGPPQQLTHFQGDQIFGFDFSPSGRLAVLRGSIKREIVRITHPILGPGVGS